MSNHKQEIEEDGGTLNKVSDLSGLYPLDLTSQISVEEPVESLSSTPL